MIASHDHRDKLHCLARALRCMQPSLTLCADHGSDLRFGCATEAWPAATSRQRLKRISGTRTKATGATNSFGRTQKISDGAIERSCHQSKPSTGGRWRLVAKRHLLIARSKLVQYKGPPLMAKNKLQLSVLHGADVLLNDAEHQDEWKGKILSMSFGVSLWAGLDGGHSGSRPRFRPQAR